MSSGYLNSGICIRCGAVLKDFNDRYQMCPECKEYVQAMQQKAVKKRKGLTKPVARSVILRPNIMRQLRGVTDEG